MNPEVNVSNAKAAEEVNEGTAEQKAAHADRVGKIKGALLMDALFIDEAVAKSTLRAMVDPCGDRAFGLALHEAREQLRQDMRLEFIVPRGAPGMLRKATAKQKLNRGVTFGRTAVKKMRRAGRVLATADAAELGSDDQQRLQMAQDKNAELVMRIEQAPRMKRAALPMGSSALPDFPGRAK